MIQLTLQKCKSHQFYDKDYTVRFKDAEFSIPECIFFSIPLLHSSLVEGKTADLSGLGSTGLTPKALDEALEIFGTFYTAQIHCDEETYTIQKSLPLHPSADSASFREVLVAFELLGLSKMVRMCLEQLGENRQFWMQQDEATAQIWVTSSLGGHFAAGMLRVREIPILMETRQHVSDAMFGVLLKEALDFLTEDRPRIADGGLPASNALWRTVDVKYRPPSHIIADGGLLAALEARKTEKSLVTKALLLIPCNRVNADERYSPLAWAAKLGDVNLVEMLLKRGAGLEGGRPTALQYALSENNTAMATLLVGHGADVNNAAGYKPPLMCAVRAGNDAIVSLLLDRGAEVNYEDAHGSGTALIAAAEAGQTHIVSLLLARGAEVNHARIPSGETAIMAAAANGHVPTVQALLLHPDVNLQTTDARQSVLNAAVQSRDVDMVKVVMQSGKVSVAASWFALRDAAKLGQLDIVLFLLAQGVMVNPPPPPAPARPHANELENI
jgi:ankyrin repeat protein